MNVTNTSTSVVLVPDTDWTFVWSGSDTILTITPIRTLRDGTTYNVVVLGTAKSAEGGYLSSNYQFSFTTKPLVISSPEDTTPAIAIIGTVIGLVLVGTVLSIEWVLFAAVLLVSPLYKRIRKWQFDDHLTQGKVQTFIEDNPGAHLRKVRRGLALPMGIVCHHLMLLEKEKMVLVKRDGLLKRYYAVPRILGRSVLKPTESQRKLLATLSDHPGVSAIALSKYMEMDENTMMKNLKVLGEAGRVRTRQTSRGTRYYASKEKTIQK
jgi:DNA-binding transcriptional ArsR family regulator